MIKTKSAFGTIRSHPHANKLNVPEGVLIIVRRKRVLASCPVEAASITDTVRLAARCWQGTIWSIFFIAVTYWKLL